MLGKSDSTAASIHLGTSETIWGEIPEKTHDTARAFHCSGGDRHKRYLVTGLQLTFQGPGINS